MCSDSWRRKPERRKKSATTNLHNYDYVQRAISFQMVFVHSFVGSLRPIKRPNVSADVTQIAHYYWLHAALFKIPKIQYPIEVLPLFAGVTKKTATATAVAPRASAVRNWHNTFFDNIAHVGAVTVTKKTDSNKLTCAVCMCVRAVRT